MAQAQPIAARVTGQAMHRIVTLRPGVNPRTPQPCTDAPAPAPDASGARLERGHAALVHQVPHAHLRVLARAHQHQLLGVEQHAQHHGPAQAPRA